MRSHFRYFAIASFIPLMLACGDATGPAPSGSRNSPGAQPTPRAPTVVSLTISPDSMLISLGTGVYLRAEKVMSDGSRISTNARWASLSPEIVLVNGVNGYAIAVGPGRTIIRADADGLVAVGVVEVPAPDGTGPPDVLTVLNFSMTEFGYDSAPGQWYYAPQLRLLAGKGRIVTVLRLTFSVPGLTDPIPSFGCGAKLAPGVPRELNGEVYGDWAMSVDGPGHLATGAEATATITYVDDTGIAGTMTVHGPIVHGSLPPSYGGDPGACFGFGFWPWG